MEHATRIDRVKRAYIRTDKEICLSYKQNTPDPELEEKSKQNDQYKASYIQERGGGKYREIRKKIEQLDHKIYLLITEIKPHADTLYAQLADILTQVAEKETCDLAHAREIMENLLYVG